MKTKEQIFEGRIHRHYESHETITDEGEYVKLEDVYKAMDEWLAEQSPVDFIVDIDKGHGKCLRCKSSWAVRDYNGHGHWVCDHCDRMLENEFEEEYR